MFCSLLSHRLKITDGFRATWIREDREQMKRRLMQLGANSVTGMKRRLMQLGANSVTGLFLGRTVKTGKE